MNSSTRKAILEQNMKRIISLEPRIHKLIGLLDLGISNVYDRDDTANIATALSDTLGQMDSDVVSLMNALTT